MDNGNVKLATIISYSTLIVGTILSLVILPYIINTLGSVEYGLFTLINSIIAYIYLIDMGLGSAIVRYNSKYLAKNDFEGLKSLNGMFLIIYGCMSLIGLLIGLTIYYNLDFIFNRGLTKLEIEMTKGMFLIALINIVTSFPLSIFTGIITAHERFVFLKVLTAIRTILNPILMLTVLTSGYDAIGIIIASTIFNIILGLINVFYSFSVLKIKFVFKKIEVQLFKEIVKYSFYVFLGVLAYNIFWSTDLFVIGIYVSASSIAIYSVGSQLNGYFTNFSKIISSMFLPRLTKLNAINKNDRETMELLIKVSRIQFFISFFMLIGFILVGKQFILIWTNEEYYLAYYIALIIMVSQVFSIIQALFAPMLEALNKHKIKSLIYLAVAFINLILTLILVQIWGIIGSAIGTAIGMFINAIANNIYYTISLKLDMKYYWLQVLKLLFPSIVAWLLGYSLTKIIIINSYLSLGIFISIFSFLYLLVFWYTGFNSFEKSIIKSPFRKGKENIFTIVKR
ncbi:oligosaccharide flippase family protein [Metabacillus sp. FJAT-52054]|uniref:Oligosaccharide flippase family protein n=1 Tax=Metabacillus sediminis TaxID=3117746 RepID=A0ABZ2NG68_9BACI